MITPLKNFTMDDIDEFTTICTDSYVASNILVLLNTESHEQFRQQTKNVFSIFVKAAEEVNANLKTDIWFNTYFRLDGAMVRARLSCEFFYYMNVISKTKFLPFYREITKTDLSYIKEGQAIVSIREVTNKDYYKRGLMKYGLIQNAKYLVSKGYIYHFAWVINPLSYKIFSQLGAEVLRTFTSKIKTGEITNYVLKMDMRKVAQMDYKIKDKQ